MLDIGLLPADAVMLTISIIMIEAIEIPLSGDALT